MKICGKPITSNYRKSTAAFVTAGLILSLLPLLFGCLGKYNHINMSATLAKGMIISGSFGTVFLVLFSGGYAYLKKYIHERGERG